MNKNIFKKDFFLFLKLFHFYKCYDRFFYLNDNFDKIFPFYRIF